MDEDMNNVLIIDNEQTVALWNMKRFSTEHLAQWTRLHIADES